MAERKYGTPLNINHAAVTGKGASIVSRDTSSSSARRSGARLHPTIPNPNPNCANACVRHGKRSKSSMSGELSAAGRGNSLRSASLDSADAARLNKGGGCGELFSTCPIGEGLRSWPRRRRWRDSDFAPPLGSGFSDSDLPYRLTIPPVVLGIRSQKRAHPRSGIAPGYSFGRPSC